MSKVDLVISFLEKLDSHEREKVLCSLSPDERGLLSSILGEAPERIEGEAPSFPGLPMDYQLLLNRLMLEPDQAGLASAARSALRRIIDAGYLIC